MHYHIYCNSRSILPEIRMAYEEFTKRLQSYCTVTLHMDTQPALPDTFNPSNHQIYYITPGVSTYTSPEFAHWIEGLQNSGQSVIHILVGYTPEEVFRAVMQYEEVLQPQPFHITQSRLAPETISLLVLEQLYRGYTILQGKTYHK